MRNYVFGGDTGLTHEQLQGRRRVAEQMLAANSRTPQNVGEGLHSIGRAIAGTILNKRNERREAELQDEANAQFEAVFGGGGFGTGQEAGLPDFAPEAASPPVAPRNFAPAPVEPRAVAAPTPSEGNVGLPPSIIRTESGGNFQAQNDAEGAGGRGHFGRGQFSRARLQDAMNAGVIPAGTTPGAFMASPTMQMAVEEWHQNDIMSRAQENGLMSYVGQDLNGSAPGGVVTPQGMLAVAHLGGFGGMSRFLETGGTYNPADVNGTSLMDYLDTHAGNIPGQTPQPTPAQPTPAQAAPQPQGRQANVAAIARAMSNPVIQQNPGRMAVLQAMLGRAMQGPETMTPYQQAQLGLAQQRFNLDQRQFEQSLQPQQATPPSSVREYEYAVQNGYEGSFADWQTAGSASTTVTVNNGGEVGTIPQGFELFTDPETGARRLQAIQGGPEDTSETDAARAAAEQNTASLQMQEIDRALNILNNGGLPASGTVGSFLSRVPGTEAADLAALLDTVGANISFEYLNQMRQQSPTGGALGNVTERELDLLRATAGSLSLNQSSQQLRENLTRLQEQFGRVIHGPDWSQPTSGIPDGIDAADWEYMTPEERALFQ